MFARMLIVISFVFAAGAVQAQQGSVPGPMTQALVIQVSNRCNISVDAAQKFVETTFAEIRVGDGTGSGSCPASYQVPQQTASLNLVIPPQLTNPYGLGDIKTALTTKRDQVCPTRRDALQCLIDYTDALLRVDVIIGDLTESAVDAQKQEVIPAKQAVSNAQNRLDELKGIAAALSSKYDDNTPYVPR